jgi:predicted membrane GTPase involved in stress response
MPVTVSGEPVEGQTADQRPCIAHRQAVRLTVTLTLEQAIAYIDDDELLEVTPPRAYAQAPLRLNVSGMQEKN